MAHALQKRQRDTLAGCQYRTATLVICELCKASPEFPMLISETLMAQADIGRAVEESLGK
jgi:hypothetical protein